MLRRDTFVTHSGCRRAAFLERSDHTVSSRLLGSSGRHRSHRGVALSRHRRASGTHSNYRQRFVIAERSQRVRDILLVFKISLSREDHTRPELHERESARQHVCSCEALRRVHGCVCRVLGSCASSERQTLLAIRSVYGTCWIHLRVTGGTGIALTVLAEGILSLFRTWPRGVSLYTSYTCTCTHARETQKRGI